MFSEDDIKLSDVVIETLNKHNAFIISDLTHKFHLWNDAKNGEIITKEKLRLDDYEYDEPESFFYYLQAVKSAKEPGELSESVSEDTVPDELLSLQFETMDGQTNEESYS